MTSTAVPESKLRLNFNDHDYSLAELPPNAQTHLRDIARIDQKITEMQFELRHLQAARELFSSELGKTMSTLEPAPGNRHEHAHDTQEPWTDEPGISVSNAEHNAG